MPKWPKVVLGVLAVGLISCGVCSAGAYWWFNANKDRLKGVGERAKAQGVAFAFEHEADECVDEALRRLLERSSIIDQAEHKLFLKACLEKATRPEGFCAGVPPRGEMLQSAAWAIERCVAKGRPQDQDCARLMQALQEACAGSTTPAPG